MVCIFAKISTGSTDRRFEVKTMFNSWYRKLFGLWDDSAVWSYSHCYRLLIYLLSWTTIWWHAFCPWTRGFINSPINWTFVLIKNFFFFRLLELTPVLFFFMPRQSLFWTGGLWSLWSKMLSKLDYFFVWRAGVTKYHRKKCFFHGEAHEH